jgi:hypothetical protein
VGERKYLYDHRGNVARVLHARPEDPWGDFAIQTVEDVEPIIDGVKVARENHDPKANMKHVARVPLTVVERAMREGWFHDKKKWSQWLNDPQNRDFRVWEGRV